jgi:hypothetical protein
MRSENNGKHAVPPFGTRSYVEVSERINCARGSFDRQD